MFCADLNKEIRGRNIKLPSFRKFNKAVHIKLLLTIIKLIGLTYGRRLLIIGIGEGILFMVCFEYHTIRTRRTTIHKPINHFKTEKSRL